MVAHNNVKAYIARILVVSLTLAVCLCLLEAGLRIRGRTPSNATYGIFKQHGDSYRLRKNVAKVTKWPALSFTTYTNSFGFRDKETGDKNIRGKQYVIFLGNSFTFANGVDFEDSFVGVFAERASGKAGVETLNLAVGGHRYADQMSVLEDFVKDAPTMPYAVLFCVDAALLYAFDQEHDSILVKSGYLFDSRSWKLAYLNVMLSNVSSAYCFFRDNARRLQAEWMNTEVSDVRPYLKVYLKDNRFADPETLLALEACLDRFERSCQRIGAMPIYVYLPFVCGFEIGDPSGGTSEDPRNLDVRFYQRLMESHCRKRNVKFVDMTPVLAEAYAAGKSLHSGGDAHYGESANRIIGEHLYKELFSEVGAN